MTPLPLMEPMRFVFICQGGVLEAKSLLLAASIRYFISDLHELTAAIPGPADQRIPAYAKLLDAVYSN